MILDILHPYKHFLHILLLLVFLPLLAHGQNNFVRNYSTDNGLASRSIFDATQDDDGLMWFTTLVGISSYDGFQWKNYNKKDGLIGSKYKYIITDQKGILWSVPFNIEDGIFTFKNGRWYKFKTPPVETKSKTEITSFAVLYNDDIPVFSVGTTIGLFVLTNNKWNYFVYNNENKPDFINSLTADDSIFYAGTENGIFEIDIHGNKKDFMYNKLLPGRAVRGISFTHSGLNNHTGTFFILGIDWLIKIKEGTPEILFKNKYIPWETDLGTTYLVYDNKNSIYFGNFLIKYLFNINSKELKPLLKKNGFTSNRATNVCVDRGNNVWITDLRGIDKITNSQVINYYESAGMLENEVSSVIEIERGSYVFGHNCGLSYMKNGSIKTILFKMNNDKQMLLSRVQDLAMDHNGYVWIAASRRGFGKWNPTYGLKWIIENQEENFLSTECDDYGNVWALSDKALYSVKENKLVKMGSPADKYGYIRKIFCFKGDKALYLIGDKGVYRYSHNRFESLFLDDKNYDLKSYALFKTGNNEFLAGTDKGVFLLKDKKLKTFTINGETISSPVYFIIKDKNQNFWFGTDNGVVILNNKMQLQKISVDNGLSGRETNRDAGLVDSYGRIWVGTDKGISCFENDFRGINIPIPSLILLNGECHDGTNFPLNKDAKLNPAQNTINFNFRGVSFINEDSVKYLVKLNGFDNEWQFLTQQQIGAVSYKNLPPGNYQLLVKTKNGQGEWSEIKESGIITIESPLYVRWWFISIILILIGSFVFYRKMENKYFHSLETAVIERTKELEESRSILEQRVKERTAELAKLNDSKDKFFSIIAHDLKNPFQALLGYDSMLVNHKDEIPPEELDDIIGYMSVSIHRLYSLLENLLTWARIQMSHIEYMPAKIGLYSSIKEITSVLQSNAQKKNIHIEVDVPEDTIISGDENMVKSILQNLVSNGIKFTPPGGSIKIGILTDEKENKIFVSDTGIGMNQNTVNNIFKIDVNITTKGTEGEVGTGLGLLICKEMVEKHGGNITVNSVEGAGSTFIVTLPK